MPQSAATHRPQRTPTSDQARGTAAERGYNYRWQKYAHAFLADNPLCVSCKEANHIQVAQCVDHIVPHRGDERLFWDQSNHQALCLSCHGVKSAKERLDR